MLSNIFDKKNSKIIEAGKKRKETYQFGKILGAGAFGAVRVATHMIKDPNTGLEVPKKVAVKAILKPSIEKQHNLQLIETEINVLKSIHHENIVQFIESFETKHNIYIVTELATGGELFDRIVKKTRFTEFDAASIILQILKAIDYLHEQGIIHRDIKPENILYLTPDDDSKVVLADFGIAQQINDPSKRLFGVAGTFGYIAPEIYAGTGEFGSYYGLGRNGYTSSCDIWSLGSLTYLLMAGRPVVDDVETAKDFLEKVKNNDFVWFDHRYWDSISAEAKDFITICLDIDNNRRPSAKELLRHPWIVNHVSKRYEAAINEEPNIIENIRTGFNASKKLQKAVRQVIIMKNLERLRQIRQNDDEEEGEAGDDDDTYTFAYNNSNESGVSDVSTTATFGSSTRTDNDSIISDFTSPLTSSNSKKELKSATLTSTFHNLVKAARENKDEIEQHIKTHSEKKD